MGNEFPSISSIFTGLSYQYSALEGPLVLGSLRAEPVRSALRLHMSGQLKYTLTQTIGTQFPAVIKGIKV